MPRFPSSLQSVADDWAIGGDTGPPMRPPSGLQLNPYEQFFDPTMSAVTMDPAMQYIESNQPAPPGSTFATRYQDPENWLAAPQGPTTFTERLQGTGGNVQVRQPDAPEWLQNRMDQQAGLYNPVSVSLGPQYESGGANSLEQLVAQLQRQSTGAAPSGFANQPQFAQQIQPGRLASEAGMMDLRFPGLIGQQGQVNWDQLIGKNDADQLRQQGLDQPWQP